MTDGDDAAHSAAQSGADVLRSMSICLVLGSSEGGVGTHVRVLAARLVRLGVQVVVYGPAATHDLFDFASTGARVVPLPVNAGIRPLANRRSVALLRDLSGSADLVHAHGLRAGFVAVRATRPGIPVVVTWHNAVLAGGPRRLLFAAIEKRIARGATLNRAVSSDLLARIHDLGGVGELGPIGATRLRDSMVPVPQTRNAIGAGDRPLVLAVGRLHPQKGFDLLVEAASQLAVRLPKPLVAIAGEGPMRRHLETRILASGAPVKLLGRRADVAELLAAADVVVMPSRWEGSPLAAHEAMLAGRPVVATAVGGLPDLAAGGALDLVPAGDAAALAAAIARVLDDRSYAAGLAERGARRALSWPSGEASADAVIARYREILTR
ncbi:MAG: glycosyltransferase family 4 protein [Actinomycetota bacterium]